MTYFTQINQTPFSTQLMIELAKTYEYKGKETHLLSIMKQNKKIIQQNVIQNDAIYCGRLLHVDLSNQKYKLITQENHQPNNRKEKLIYNFLKSFQIMHQTKSNWKLTASGVIEIFDFIFNDYDPNASIDRKRNRVERRQTLEQLVMQYNKTFNENQYEKITFFAAFIIDFINLRIFDDYNELVGMILLMLLLKEHDFKIVDFESFFLTIFEQEEAFIEAINKSSLNWEIGLPQYHFFTMFVVQILNEMYERFEKLGQNVASDKQYSKEELVMQIIESFTGHFTKEEIRQYNPFISDSTINRTLKTLKDQGLIEPLGKGRSAKWRKIRTNKYINY